MESQEARTLTANKHCTQVQRLQDIIDMNSYVQDLKYLHGQEDEPKLVHDKEMTLVEPK